MSGSGPSGGGRDDWRPSVPIDPTGADECDISELTILSSPNWQTVKTLSINTVLIVELEGQDRQRLVAKTEVGAIAGAITSKAMPKIVECIQAGYSYGAIVVSVEGGRVEVRVQRR